MYPSNRGVSATSLGEAPRSTNFENDRIQTEARSNHSQQLSNKPPTDTNSDQKTTGAPSQPHYCQPLPQYPPNPYYLPPNYQYPQSGPPMQPPYLSVVPSPNSISQPMMMPPGENMMKGPPGSWPPFPFSPYGIPPPFTGPGMGFPYPSYPFISRQGGFMDPRQQEFGYPPPMDHRQLQREKQSDSSKDGQQFGERKGHRAVIDLSRNPLHTQRGQSAAKDNVFSTPVAEKELLDRAQNLMHEIDRRIQQLNQKKNWIQERCQKISTSKNDPKIRSNQTQLSHQNSERKQQNADEQEKSPKLSKKISKLARRQERAKLARIRFSRAGKNPNESMNNPPSNQFEPNTLKDSEQQFRSEVDEKKAHKFSSKEAPKTDKEAKKTKGKLLREQRRLLSFGSSNPNILQYSLRGQSKSQKSMTALGEGFDKNSKGHGPSVDMEPESSRCSVKAVICQEEKSREEGLEF